MKKIALFVLLSAVLACNNSDKKDTPDVSAVPVELTVKRFDQDFFAIDTNSLDKDLGALQQKYPDFLQIYLESIIGADRPEALIAFYRSYKPAFDSTQLIYKDFTPVQKQIEQAFRYVKHYFPSYTTPSVILPVVGPMNTRENLARLPNGELTPVFMGSGFLGISLQFYLGKDFSYYNSSEFIAKVAPLFRSRRFAKEYIIADVMKLIVDDIFPDKSNTKPFIEQVIEKGKQWWLLDKFLPDVPDSIKTGYRQQQLNWVTANEGLVWSYILKNETDLYTLNPATIQTYIGEAPFTNVFSQEESPGNIGPWIGWQIIKKFVDNNSGLTAEQVMQTPAKKILEGAKYKPK